MSDGCDGHAGLPAELRVLVLGALDRLAPVLERMHAEQAPGEPAAPGGGTGSPCTVCPVCAVIAAWRGERTELAARAVDHATGLVAVLRAALDEGAGAPGAADESAPRQRPHPPRPVQRISVHR